MKAVFGKVAAVLAAGLLVLPVSGCTPAAQRTMLSLPTVTETAGAQAVSVLAAPPLPPSPFVGSITSHSDAGALYAVDLDAGDAFGARIRASLGSAVGLVVYTPETSSVEQHDNVVAGFETDGYPGYVVTDSGSMFVAPTAGTYLLRVLNLGGPCDYTVDWAKGFETTIALSIAPNRPARGTASTISGVVLGPNGVPAVGERVELWSAPYPDRFMTKRVAETVVDQSGRYSFRVTTLQRMRYQVVTLGALSGYALNRSATRSIVPEVGLTAPRVTIAAKYRDRPFTVWGYLKPAHAAGEKSVRIRCFRREKQTNGTYKYVWRRTVYATNHDYSATATKYKTTIKLPGRGRWRLYAYASGDGAHSATTSTALTVTVK